MLIHCYFYCILLAKASQKSSCYSRSGRSYFFIEGITKNMCKGYGYREEKEIQPLFTISLTQTKMEKKSYCVHKGQEMQHIIQSQVSKSSKFSTLENSLTVSYTYINHTLTPDLAIPFLSIYPGEINTRFQKEIYMCIQKGSLQLYS